MEASYLLLQNAIELTDTHLTSQSNKLALVSTEDVIAEVEQIILKQFSSQSSVVANISGANLLKQATHSGNRTSVRALVDIGTICQTVALREQESCFLSLLPLTKSLPILIISPQIRALASLRIFQCDSQHSAISITGNIVAKTKILQMVTHLKRSLIVDDICLITILLISRTDTAHLTARKKQVAGNV